MNVRPLANERRVTRRHRGLVRASVILGACRLLGVIETTQLYGRDLLSDHRHTYTGHGQSAAGPRTKRTESRIALFCFG